MKQKQIYDFVKDIVLTLQRKVDSESQKTNFPLELSEYSKGQLYEAGYILEQIESIIFKD